MKTIKWIGFGLLVVAIGGFLIVGARRRSRADATDDAATQVSVVRGDIETMVASSGRVVPLAEATLAFDVPGTVAQVLVEEGQWVEKRIVL